MAARRLLLACAILLACVMLDPRPALACIWDDDTLRDERRGLPGIAEILAGKWEKHSRFFYEQRAARMKERIAANPQDLAAYDNLAVAHEKLGDQEAAIEVMLQKEKIKPGEYTTHANLGTFYLHKGDLDKGIEHIRRALEINPAAHFGREEYQLRAAVFLREAQKNPALREQHHFLSYDPENPSALPWMSEAMWDGSPEKLRDMRLKDNVFDGIVGMIRFGTGTSAELYFVLGDLLGLRGDRNLAYRAYARALDLKHPREADIQKRMEWLTTAMHDHNEVNLVTIAAERREAEAWVKAYQDYEDALLREGKDVSDEASYEPFYRAHGRAVTDPGPPGWTIWKRILVPGGIVGIALLLLTLTVRRRARARRTRAA